MKYCSRRSQCEMKFASSHLRSKYFTAKLFHLAKPNFTRRKANFVEKTTGRNLSFFLAGVEGFASLATRPAPPLLMASFAHQLFCCHCLSWQSVFLSKNGSYPQIPPRIRYSINTPRQNGAGYLWLGWRDLNPRVAESESDALPLGYTPLYVVSA